MWIDEVQEKLKKRKMSCLKFTGTISPLILSCGF
jgi:hypothetical protein